MQKLKKLFGGIEMTWKRVILFAIITGVFTGLIMYPDFLKETSFQDIGISFECWILFAVIVCVNCKKPLEAAIKCFVFFLISQPLVYVVEIPKIGHFAWEYYEYWLKWTVLTLPGGFIAWYAKKQNILGALILSVACMMLGGLAAEYCVVTASSFPNHLLTAIFCIALIFVFTLCIQESKGHRVLVIVLALAAFAGYCTYIMNMTNMSNYLFDDEQNYTLVSVDNDNFDITVEENDVSITAKGIFRKATVVVADEAGNEYVLFISTDGDGLIDVELQK